MRGRPHSLKQRRRSDESLITRQAAGHEVRPLTIRSNLTLDLAQCLDRAGAVSPITLMSAPASTSTPLSRRCSPCQGWRGSRREVRCRSGENRLGPDGVLSAPAIASLARTFVVIAAGVANPVRHSCCIWVAARRVGEPRGAGEYSCRSNAVGSAQHQGGRLTRTLVPALQPDRFEVRLAGAGF